MAPDDFIIIADCTGCTGRKSCTVRTGCTRCDSPQCTVCGMVRARDRCFGLLAAADIGLRAACDGDARSRHL